ncbi:putative siderophore synthetase component [Trichinella spiralis]|uniref:putative siderophore synthetase component n=1 Tax=Trichinella spiralis TaxID=6334 RepID=UPI0001EFEF75|nr:putative siderophore synthetase component [Trichinella spiralis]
MSFHGRHHRRYPPLSRGYDEQQHQQHWQQQQHAAVIIPPPPPANLVMVIGQRLHNAGGLWSKFCRHEPRRREHLRFTRRFHSFWLFNTVPKANMRVYSS